MPDLKTPDLLTIAAGYANIIELFSRTDRVLKIF